MSERITIALIAAGGAIFCSLIVGLVFIAVHEGDGTSALIVTALLGVFGTLVPGATALVGHILGAKAAIGGQAQAQAQNGVHA